MNSTILVCIVKINHKVHEGTQGLDNGDTLTPAYPQKPEVQLIFEATGFVSLRERCGKT